MVIDTKHGQFECNEITRKQRRDLYKEVKLVGSSEDPSKLHDLADKFANIAFGNEEDVSNAIGHLSPLQEDEVLNEIIACYMGFDLGKDIGD
tara:strand:+ start:358 stop:633 length:276 start_codon:yes stop_codon:yes gene_type:complete